MEKLEKLSAAQEKQLAVTRDKWIRIGLSTKPIDREVTKEAVRLSYECGGLKPPKMFVFLDSPFQGAIGAYILSRVGAQVGAQVRDQIWLPCYGNQEIWLSFYDYFKENTTLKNLNKVEGQILAAKNCGWWWPFEKVAIITNRPKILEMDSQKRLKTIIYPDGWGFHCWRGQVLNCLNNASLEEADQVRFRLELAFPQGNETQKIEGFAATILEHIRKK